MSSQSGPHFLLRLFNCENEGKDIDAHIQALEGRDVKDLLLNVGSGGGAAAAVPAASGAPAAGAAAEEAPKEEEKEEGMNIEIGSVQRF
jgi:ribosomal protein L12E/L44/L45/RPP1/RPP2